MVENNVDLNDRLHSFLCYNYGHDCCIRKPVNLPIFIQIGENHLRVFPRQGLYSLTFHSLDFPYLFTLSTPDDTHVRSQTHLSRYNVFANFQSSARTLSTIHFSRVHAFLVSLARSNRYHKYHESVKRARYIYFCGDENGTSYLKFLRRHPVSPFFLSKETTQFTSFVEIHASYRMFQYFLLLRVSFRHCLTLCPSARYFAVNEARFLAEANALQVCAIL